MVSKYRSQAFEQTEGLTPKEIKVAEFRKWARELVERANNGSQFLEAYESPDDVCLSLQREYPEPR